MILCIQQQIFKICPDAHQVAGVLWREWLCDLNSDDGLGVQGGWVPLSIAEAHRDRVQPRCQVVDLEAPVLPVVLESVSKAPPSSSHSSASTPLWRSSAQPRTTSGEPAWILSLCFGSIMSKNGAVISGLTTVTARSVALLALSIQRTVMVRFVLGVAGTSISFVPFQVVREGSETNASVTLTTPSRLQEIPLMPLSVSAALTLTGTWVILPSP